VSRIKTIILQSFDTKGELVSENKVDIQENDRLILRYPDNYTQSKVLQIHHLIKEFLESDHDVLSLPKNIELSVLRV
jgi:predicted acyltransferase (DUF342 family)